MVAINYCITINNYNDTTITKVKTLVQIKYGIFGEEVAPTTGTKHLQGYVSWTSKTRATTVANAFKKLLGVRPHVVAARGTPIQNKTYCSKEGKVTEWGTMPEASGARTDIAAMYEAVAQGTDEYDIATAMPETHAKYYKAADRYRKLCSTKKGLASLKEEMALSQPIRWQMEVLDLLKYQGTRQVLWVVDLDGNKGKTWLAKWLMVNNDAFVADNAKAADLAHAYGDQEYVVLDYTRSQEDWVNYSFIESLKNGRIFAPKYESTVRVFKPAKVLCLSNWWPDETQLSSDRWMIYDLATEGPATETEEIESKSQSAEPMPGVQEVPAEFVIDNSFMFND